MLDPAARNGDLEAWVAFVSNQQHGQRYRELPGGSAGILRILHAVE